MNFTTGYILTKAGEALQAKAESGTELKLTKMQLGSGTAVSVDDYYERTALIEPKNAMSISEIKQVTTEKNLCVAIAVLTNAAVDTSYTASELGLFAQDTDGTEILYAVSYDSNPTYIASKDDGTDITMKFYMYIVSTSDINITLTLPKTAEEIATVAAGYAAKAAESEAKAKQLEATANDYLQTTQQAMTLANGYANISKAWAEGNASPDGAVDTNSPTGYTQSAKIWAALSREYAGMSKFKLPIGYYKNVAEMKSSDTAIIDRPCVTLGYYEPNDGGGGVYIIRQKKESDVDDGGSIIVLDNGNAAELIADGAVNVKQFGAAGDGTTDDASSIQSAIDFCRNSVLTNYPNFKNSVTTVILPSGKYVIKSEIKLPRYIKLKSAGIVMINSSVTNGSAIHIVGHQSGDVNFREKYDPLYRFRGPLIDGSDGGIHIFSDNKTSSIGIEIGDADISDSVSPAYLSQVSCFSILDVGISGFSIGMKFNTHHVYISNFYNMHIELNDVNVQYGDENHNSPDDAGEKFTFIGCNISSGKSGIKWYTYSFDTDCYGCSFDFNTVDFDCTNADGSSRSISVFGGHFEGTGEIVANAATEDYGMQVMLSGVNILKNTSLLFSGGMLLFVSNCKFGTVNYSVQMSTFLSLCDDNVKCVEQGSQYDASLYAIIGQSQNLIDKFVRCTVPQSGKSQYTFESVGSTDKIIFKTVTLTGGTDFTVDSTSIATTVANIATALNANSTFSATYTAGSSGSILTITEKNTGTGNNPCNMKIVGTGTIRETNRVPSVGENVQIGTYDGSYYINTATTYPIDDFIDGVSYYGSITCMPSMTATLPTGSPYSSALKLHNNGSSAAQLDTITLPCAPMDRIRFGICIYNASTSDKLNVSAVCKFYNVKGELIKNESINSTYDGISAGKWGTWYSNSDMAGIAPAGAMSFSITIYLSVPQNSDIYIAGLSIVTL